ncbi:FAD/NAD(P)-binding domain-containing protein [Linnemannia elongata AG-77]|uniref:FAD/NAD(P)-binding domain-containing protein n=1 Tax=Linnemannia elongata AG-77 TaxID=1314771 RepID=A0A197JXC0_9FUNG|nr:FAD/NAD(P)-binding domain-containing protein [Linnemannia elongata AG-77]
MEINPAFANIQRPNLAPKIPSVIIVGGGIAGMILALALEKSKLSYEIFERASEVKALGSALYFNASTAALFKQLGIYEDMRNISKDATCIQMANEQREVEYKMDFKGQLEMFGSTGYIVARPMLYDILRSKVPSERFHMNKKILSLQQGGNGALIRCSDGSTIEGDIIVGADGAYSAVRQNMYAQLKKNKKLPASDDVDLPFSTVCLVGQTRPLNPEEYPNLKLEDCQFMQTLGDKKPYSWTYFTTKQSTIAWMVILFLDDTTRQEHDPSRNSEWGPEAANAMCEKVRHFPIITGSERPWTLGDLIDNTPKELISKVLLEEKVFDTWYSGRAVLIGDACHKLNPAGGAGANNAIHDAVALANRLQALPDQPSVEDIEKAFKLYKKERLPKVKEAYNSSVALKYLVEQNMKGALMRHMSKNMPMWLNRKMLIRMISYQPQLSYVDLVPNEGTVRPAHQQSLADAMKKAKKDKLKQERAEAKAKALSAKGPSP